MRKAPLAFTSNEIQGFIHNWARQNHWKVSYQLPEFEDIVQEGGVVYTSVCNEYPNIDNPAWFMGMFKTSFCNHMCSFARKDSVRRTSMVDMPEDAELAAAITPHTENTAYFERKMEQAPSEIKELISLIASLPGEMWDLVHAASSKGTGRTQGNKLLCDLTGRPNPKKNNLIDEVRQYISEH